MTDNRIHIVDIESAINYWRDQSPSHEGVDLCPQVRELAKVYALMVFHGETEVSTEALSAEAYAAWLGWYATTPDTPCIAICSTSQGDSFCKGCGRSFSEVQHWPELTPVQKQQIWRRIATEGLAWRFNRYAERAMEHAQERLSSRLL